MNARSGAAFWIPACLLGLILAFIIVLPLLSLHEFVLGTTDPIPTSKGAGELFATTLILSVSVTVIASLLGTMAGLGLFVLPSKIRMLFLYLSMTAFFIPSYVYAVAWIELTGAKGWLTAFSSALHLPTLEARHLFTLWGTIAVLSLTHYPLVMCGAYAACTRIDTDKIEAARTEGSLWPVMVHVMLPHAAPFIATGSLVVYLLTLTTYALPSLFQVTTYSVEIFSMYNAFHDPFNGIRQTFPVIALAFAAIVVWWVFIRTRISHTAFVPVQKRDVQAGTGTRLVVSLGLAGLLLVGAGLPLAMLAARVTSLDSLAEAWRTTQSEWIASLSLATLTALFILLLSGLGAFMSEGANRFVGPGIVGLLVMPYLISGPAWGIALISFWNQAGWRAWVYDHAVIGVVACVGKYLFVGWLGFSFALRSVRQDYKDAARVFGLSGWRQFFTITVPLIAPYIAVTGAILFLLALGEVDSLLLVSPPGFTTVPVRVYGLMHYGPSELVASMALLMVIVIGAVGLSAVLLRWIFGRLLNVGR